MSLIQSARTTIDRLLGRPRQIGEEEFKTHRRESFDPVTRSGACYVPMPGYENTIHYQDKQNLHHLGRYEWAVRVLSRLPVRARVLDCACGVGYGSRKLAELFERVDAVDVFEEAIAIGRERYAHPRIEWHCLDAVRLREVFKESSFDAVVSFQTIESIVEDRRFLDDVKDLLKPDGLLLIDTPIRKQHVSNPDNLHHRRYYGLDEWVELLGSRFEVEIFDGLPDADFLRRCLLPSQGSIAVCRKSG